MVPPFFLTRWLQSSLLPRSHYLSTGWEASGGPICRRPMPGTGGTRTRIRRRTRKGLPPRAAVSNSGSSAEALVMGVGSSEDPLPVTCLRGSPKGLALPSLDHSPRAWVAPATGQTSHPSPSWLHPPASPRVGEGKSPPPAPAESGQPGRPRLPSSWREVVAAISGTSRSSHARDQAWPWTDLGGGVEPSPASRPGEEVREVGQGAGEVHPSPQQTPSSSQALSEAAQTATRHPKGTRGPTLLTHPTPTRPCWVGKEAGTHPEHCRRSDHLSHSPQTPHTC